MNSEEHAGNGSGSGSWSFGYSDSTDGPTNWFHNYLNTFCAFLFKHSVSLSKSSMDDIVLNIERSKYAPEENVLTLLPPVLGHYLCSPTKLVKAMNFFVIIWIF